MPGSSRKTVLVVTNDRLFATLHEVGTILLATLSGDDPFFPAAEAIRRACALELVAIGTVEGGSVVLRTASPACDRDRAEGLLGARGARRVMLSEVQERGAEPGELGALWTPILRGPRVAGILAVVSGRPAGPTPDELRALGIIGEQLAGAFANHESIAGLRARAEQLETTIRERTATLERQIRFTGQIIDSLPVSLYVVDRDRTIVAWNRQREMGNQGLQREKALGRSVFEVFDHQARHAIEHELAPVFGRGETLALERDSMVGGEVRHYRIHKLPMRLEPGEVTHVLTIGEDITEQRRMEKSMVVTEKMAAMGRLAAGVAHEINNPLATIVTCAEGLENRVRELPLGAQGDAEFLEYLQIVKQEAYRAKRITEDLLDFSRVRPSQRRVQSLEKILDRTLLILKHHDGFKRIEVERHFDEHLPEVAVEEDAIVQAFVALIINALDAMPDGGRLMLTTSSQGGDVRCEVTDSGCGIAPADLAQIFEPFFTTKPPGRGTGLGLAVCYGIVKAHGGRIEVQSSHGQGSRFTVVLPVARAGAHDSEENQECSLPSPSGF